MPGTDIGWAGLLTSLALVAVAVALSAWQRLRQEPDIGWASARMLAQLLAVGVVLDVLFAQPVILSWGWVAFMVVFAAATVRRRAAEVPDAFPIALLSLGAAAVVTLGVVFGLGIFPVEPRFVVPIGGMMIGNTLQYTVVSARRMIEELRDHQAEVEVRLALGQPWRQAARPYLRSAVRTAVLPQIERTKAVGLISLPGLMTGLILAGVDPVDAVLAQAAIMYLILGAVATTTTTVALGLSRRLFTPDHRLVRLPRPAEVG
jgi:putative ABC transport system permease protein